MIPWSRSSAGKRTRSGESWRDGSQVISASAEQVPMCGHSLSGLVGVTAPRGTILEERPRVSSAQTAGDHRANCFYLPCSPAAPEEDGV